MDAPRILVIDDEPLISRTTLHLLTREGMRGYAAFTGQEGLDAAHAERPDLILLDISLPDCSGWDILDALRDDALLRTTPVVVFSAATDAAAQARIRKANITGFLPKPFTVRQLKAVLENVFGLEPGNA